MSIFDIYLLVTQDQKWMLFILTITLDDLLIDDLSLSDLRFIFSLFFVVCFYLVIFWFFKFCTSSKKKINSGSLMYQMTSQELLSEYTIKLIHLHKRVLSDWAILIKPIYWFFMQRRIQFWSIIFRYNCDTIQSINTIIYNESSLLNQYVLIYTWIKKNL